MKITKEFLKEKSACSGGVAWFLEQKETDALKVLKKLIEQEKMDWANWLIVTVMTRPQYLAYAIYAAEQVIDIFEKQYPDDKRPRLAIQAAKAVLGNDTRAARAAAWEAWDAGDAARAAAGAAGWEAWAAVGAAGAAVGAARAAAWEAWEAGDAARAAAGAAPGPPSGPPVTPPRTRRGRQGRHAFKKMQLKILEFGISLFGRRRKCRNDPFVILNGLKGRGGIRERLRNAYESGAWWKMRLLNQWKFFFTVRFLALGMSVAYAQAVIKPCIVSDGAYQAAQEIQASETLRPIAQTRFTATAVVTSSCSICRKGRAMR